MSKLLYMLALCVLLIACCATAFALSDDEEAVKQGVKAPEAWVFPAHTPLRVLTVRGLWYEYYGIERALARLGGAYVSESWHSPKSLRYYPESYDLLMRHHLVVVGNVNGNAFGPARRKMLKDYVEQGGAVLLLGGKFAFGKQYHGNALEEISPVTYPEASDQVGVPDGLPLTPGPDRHRQRMGRVAVERSSACLLVPPCHPESRRESAAERG